MKASMWPRWPLVCSHTHLCRKKMMKKDDSLFFLIKEINIRFFMIMSISCIKKHTRSWSQRANVGGICTHTAILSTVRLSRALWRSIVMWCQCWSSNRLPKETWYRPSGEELVPGGGLGQKIKWRRRRKGGSKREDHPCEINQCLHTYK